MRRCLSLLTACVLLLTALPLYADDAEDQAVKAVENLEGAVIRDTKDPARPVVEVNLAGIKVTDVVLKELAVLKELKMLGLKQTQVTDAGLKELTALQGLQKLD